MTCFFIGHHDAEFALMPQIETAVDQHITQFGVTEFVVGQYGAFDRMAFRAVMNAKKRFPHISLCVLLPYHPSVRPIRTPEGYDYTFYPPELESVPPRFAISKANQYMIKHCNYLISYAPSPIGNAKKFLETAQRQSDLVITELSRISDTL